MVITASLLQFILIEEESSGRWKSVKALSNPISNMWCHSSNGTYYDTSPLRGVRIITSGGGGRVRRPRGPAAGGGWGLGGAVRNVTRRFPRRLDALWCERPSYWISPSAITHVPCTRHRSKPWTSTQWRRTPMGKPNRKSTYKILTPTRIAFLSLTQFIWHTVTLK